MQVLTISEFRKLCNEIAPVTFSFCAENQSGVINRDLYISEEFNEIKFTFSPNVICLKNDHGVLSFRRVKSIYYYEEKNDIGFLFKIVCGSCLYEGEDTSFTIFADKF